MLETFTFIPNTKTSGQVKYRTKTAQFGDGYAQRVGDGINVRKTQWPMEFIGMSDDIVPIKEFLDRHAGHQPFLWTAPLDTQREFVTPEGYNITPMGADNYTLTVTLVENNPV